MSEQAPPGRAPERGVRKETVGEVVSDARDKTITVTVERRIVHPLYRKTLARTKRHHVHDEHNEARVGDIVRIAETRPRSKHKRWRLVEIVRRAE